MMDPKAFLIRIV